MSWDGSGYKATGELLDMIGRSVRVEGEWDEEDDMIGIVRNFRTRTEFLVEPNDGRPAYWVSRTAIVAIRNG